LIHPRLFEYTSASEEEPEAVQGAWEEEMRRLLMQMLLQQRLRPQMEMLLVSPW
jgi:hypothetical protein